MTANTQKNVVILPGPTGPTGLFEGVNIYSAFTGATGQFPQWAQLGGPTGPTGTFKTVYNATGATGHRHVIVPGFTGDDSGGGGGSSALLLEDESNLLLETGDRLLLET